jgi:cyclopropane-fatty-acyl-phospholipid synthase
MLLAEVFETVMGSRTGVAFEAFDGSRSGDPDSPLRIEVRSPRAIELALSHPGQVGLARAYVAGEVEIHGDLVATFTALEEAGAANLSWGDRMTLLREFGPLYLRHADALRRGDLPPEEKRLAGRRHSKWRDAEAISHHYDVSNDFYRMVLGPSMAYTCATFPSQDATLEQAQEEKFDLVCRKLDLRPGQRLLDVGCGWGGMVRHAATHYGVRAIGVTLSQSQAEWGQAAIDRAGLADRAEVRFGDYRDIPETGFDAISSIGLTEHIGLRNYPAYFSFLRSRVRPEGRLLNHSITRANDVVKAHHPNGFINRYVFPDGELTGPGRVLQAMTAQGWECQHSENLRIHYALTLRRWLDNLEENWDAAVAEVGERKARVWRLYMAASEFGFRSNRIQLHQFLATNTVAGRSGYPLSDAFRPLGVPATATPEPASSSEG